MNDQAIDLEKLHTFVWQSPVVQHIRILKPQYHKDKQLNLKIGNIFEQISHKRHVNDQ